MGGKFRKQFAAHVHWTSELSHHQLSDVQRLWKPDLRFFPGRHSLHNVPDHLLAKRILPYIWNLQDSCPRPLRNSFTDSNCHLRFESSPVLYSFWLPNILVLHRGSVGACPYSLCIQ